VSTGWQESSDNVSADAEVSKAAHLSIGSGGVHGPPGLAAPFHAQIEVGLRHGSTAQQRIRQFTSSDPGEHSECSKGTSRADEPRLRATRTTRRD
jgi:hypothetical protein